MIRKDFEKIIVKLQLAIARCDSVNNSGINVIDFVDPFYFIISVFFESYFGEDVSSTIDWYLYEYKKGEMKIFDSETEDILYDLDQEGELWRFVVENNANPK